MPEGGSTPRPRPLPRVRHPRRRGPRPPLRAQACPPAPAPHRRAALRHRRAHRRLRLRRPHHPDAPALFLSPERPRLHPLPQPALHRRRYPRPSSTAPAPAQGLIPALLARSNDWLVQPPGQGVPAARSRKRRGHSRGAPRMGMAFRNRQPHIATILRRRDQRQASDCTPRIFFGERPVPAEHELFRWPLVHRPRQPRRWPRSYRPPPFARHLRVHRHRRLVFRKFVGVCSHLHETTIASPSRAGDYPRPPRSRPRLPSPRSLSFAPAIGPPSRTPRARRRPGIRNSPDPLCKRTRTSPTEKLKWLGPSSAFRMATSPPDLNPTPFGARKSRM